MIVGLGSPGAASQPTRPVTQVKGPVAFDAVGDLTYELTDVKLRGGKPADPSQYRASFYSKSADGMCTSTLVGPRALLTAAHCVPAEGTITIRMGAKSWQATCTHHPRYAKNETADWAACAFTSDGPKVPYERVNGDPTLLKVDAALELTGFGCITDQGTGGNDGIYRIGEAKIVRLPKDQDFDVVTQGPVGLCFGDSGGPSFRYADSERKSRVVVGVNSRVGQDGSGNLNAHSYLSSTSAATDFLKEWATSKGVQVCGLTADAPGCHE
jgi:hypothetical protein